MAELNEGTAIPASGAGTGQPAGSPPAITGQAGATPPEVVEVGEDGKPLPFDKDPKWKAARQAERTLQGLMTELEVDDVDELKELLLSGKQVSGKVDLAKLDAIIAKAETLEKYEAYWASQEEVARRAEEEPEVTADRLARENVELKRQNQLQAAAQENKKSLEDYDRTVKTGVKELLPDLSKDQMEFLLMALGVDNPALDIDLKDKMAVAKAVKSTVKRFDALRQSIIKNTLEGKGNIPDIPRGGSGEGPISNTGEPKTLKESRRMFLGLAGKIFNQ